MFGGGELQAKDFKAIAQFSVFEGCFGNSAACQEKKTISPPAAKENLLIDMIYLLKDKKTVSSLDRTLGSN